MILSKKVFRPEMSTFQLLDRTVHYFAPIAKERTVNLLAWIQKCFKIWFFNKQKNVSSLFPTDKSAKVFLIFARTGLFWNCHFAGESSVAQAMIPCGDQNSLGIWTKNLSRHFLMSWSQYTPRGWNWQNIQDNIFLKGLQSLRDRFLLPCLYFVERGHLQGEDLQLNCCQSQSPADLLRCMLPWTQQIRWWKPMLQCDMTGQY